MAIIIPKVFTSEYSPEARKNLGFRGGNHDAFLKVAEAAIRANVIAKDSIANRWAKAADDEQAMDRIAQTVYGASSTALASLPVVKFDPEGKCFTIGGRQVGVDRCDMNKLYLGLVSVDGTALALVDDDEFDNIQAAMKGTPVADAMNAVEDRNHVLERKLDNAKRVDKNVVHDENGNVRIPFITSLRKKSREKHTGFIASATTCDANSPKYLPLIFINDYTRYSADNNIDKLMTCMFGIQGSASPDGPCYIYGHKPMLTGSTGKGTAGTDHHDVLSTVKNVKPETPVFNDTKDITLRNSLIAKISDKSSYVPVRDIGDDVKFAANTYSIKITKDEMQYLCAILEETCYNPEIDVNKKQEDKTKGQGDEHHQNTGSSFDARQSNAVHTRAMDNQEQQDADVMNALRTKSGMVGEFDAYMNNHAVGAMKAIDNIVRNVGNLDANASLASDRFFTKEYREIAGHIFRPEMTVSGAMTVNQEISHLVAGVVRALLTHTSSDGESYFDADRVKVDQHDGIWYISDFGLLQQYEDMHVVYQSGAVLEDDTPFEIEDDFITLLLREMYKPNQITSDIRYLVYMAQDIAKMVGASKDNKSKSNIQGSDMQLDEVISTELPKVLAQSSKKAGYVPTEAAIWNALKKQPLVNIENLYSQLNSIAPALGAPVLCVIAVDMLANSYQDANERYLALSSNSFFGKLAGALSDEGIDPTRYSEAFNAVNKFELQNTNVPSGTIGIKAKPRLSGMVIEYILGGATQTTRAAIDTLKNEVPLIKGKNAVDILVSIPKLVLASTVVRYALTGLGETLTNEDVDTAAIGVGNHISQEQNISLVNNTINGFVESLKNELYRGINDIVSIAPDVASKLRGYVGQIKAPVVSEMKTGDTKNEYATAIDSIKNSIKTVLNVMYNVYCPADKNDPDAPKKAPPDALVQLTKKTNSIQSSICTVSSPNEKTGNYTVDLCNLDNLTIVSGCGNLSLNPEFNITFTRVQRNYGYHLNQVLTVLNGDSTIDAKTIKFMKDVPTYSSLFDRAVDSHDENTVSDFVRMAKLLTEGGDIAGGIGESSRLDKGIVNFRFRPNPPAGFDDTHTTLKVSNRLDTGISSDMARQLNPNTDEQHRLAQLMAGMDDDDTL